MHHKDVNTLVAQHLSIHDLTSFVRTCSLFNKCGQPFLDTEAFQRLLSCAKYGKKQEAKALLHKVSIASIRLLEILLTRRVTFKDAGEYRTYVNRTIGQFVLSSNNEDFWEMLQPYYKLIPNGETIMLSQIAEQFPGPPQKLVNHYDFGSLVFAFNEMNSGLEENVSVRR